MKCKFYLNLNVWSFFKLKNSWRITHEQEQAFLSFQQYAFIKYGPAGQGHFELFEGISYFPVCLTVGMQAPGNSTAL